MHLNDPLTAARVAARDRATRLRVGVGALLTLVGLGSTGALAGALAPPPRPQPASTLPGQTPPPPPNTYEVRPAPRRTVYVGVPAAPGAPGAAPRQRSAPRRAVRPPAPAVAPPVTTSAGS